jgi:hypothetical protein
VPGWRDKESKRNPERVKKRNEQEEKRERNNVRFIG